jgi:PAS domain S-box-containing protein
VSDQPLNILLVDDQPAKLLAYETILGSLGENLVKANSAREALECLLRQDIAVMLIDVQMPELDGFELAALIRGHPRYQKTAIVFVSGAHMTNVDLLRGYATGAVDFVTVPIVPEILRAKVGVFTELYRKTRELETLNLELERRVVERTAALEASTLELRVGEQRLSLALDSAGAASWDWDAIADRLDWTPRFRRLYGFADDDPPKLVTVLARVHDDDRERLTARVERMLSTPGDDEWNENFRIDHPDRGVRDVSGLGRCFRDASGHVVRMTGIDLDVTERMQTERALKDADRRKDEFIATLSHELRNPLAPILNALDVLDLHDEDKRSRAQAVIKRQVQHMVRLVDDLLDVARMTRGAITLQRDNVDLAEVVARALEACGPALDTKGLAVHVHAEPNLSIHGDLTRLVQVLANLLGNATKFTPAGGRIDIGTRRDGDHVVLAVRDSGAGIDRELLPRVFDMFLQAPTSPERISGGLGIGLALTRQLVVLHGGTVTARSDGPGRGSEFVVRLPFSPAPADLVEVASVPALPVPRRILVADDNEDLLEMLSWMLTTLGHDVHTARDGVEAVEAASKLRPQLVILDIDMPRLDGYGAARRIREAPWGRAMKLVAQSGFGQDTDKRKANEAGFDVHLTKPVELDKLSRILAELTRSR